MSIAQALAAAAAARQPERAELCARFDIAGRRRVGLLLEHEIPQRVGTLLTLLAVYAARVPLGACTAVYAVYAVYARAGSRAKTARVWR